MSLEVILPAIAGLATGLLAPALRTFFSRQQTSASIAEDQARAMSVYWERISSLEDKVEDLEQENKRLREEHQREKKQLREESQALAAEVGRLRIRLDYYEGRQRDA